MKLSELQTRSWPLRTEGAVGDLLNTRPDILDCYHPVPLPRRLAATGRRILGLDRRGDVENVISLDPALGALYLEGTLDRYDVYTDRSEMLCGDVGDAIQTAPCGDYLAVRRADASLYFLRWDDDARDYTPLGEMPRDLTFSVERVPAGSMTFAVPATDWGVKADDLRSAIPDQARRRTAEAVKRAWTEAVDDVYRAGCFLQPTTVRVMARLWDGSVFCVSEAVRVPDADWHGYDRFLLPVAYDADGKATGTTGGSFSLQPYTVKVSVDSLQQPLWNDVFRCLEIYAEPERSPLSASEASIAFAAANHALSLFLPTHPKREMEGWLGSGPYRLAATARLPLADALTFGPSDGKTLDELPTQQALTGEADVLLAHGAFLHIARGSRLLTTEAGNPLAAVASTSFGSRIKALAAMPGAGGAYTRQYIYVCTENSIFALTCDALGRHTNCRPVSPQTLTDPSRILSADDAVYALCDSGALLRLRSARAETLFRGLPAFGALAWDATANELWLMQCRDARLVRPSTGEEASDVVLQLGAPWLAYRRDVGAAYSVPQCGRVLFADAGGALCQARSYVDFRTFAADAEQARLTMTLDAPADRWLSLRGASIAPAAFDISVSAEDETLMLTTARVDTDADAMHHVADATTVWEHAGRRHFLLPFVAPVAEPYAISPTRLRLTLTGRWSALETPLLRPLRR